LIVASHDEEYLFFYMMNELDVQSF
jgi:hypothetical protein